MGRQIVYCDGCGKLLKEEDFDKGRAHVVENRSFCIECKPLPKEPSAGSSAAHRALGSSTKLKSLANPTPRSMPRVSPGSTARTPVIQDGPPSAKSKAPLAVGVGIAAVVILVVIVLAASGGSRTEEGTRVDVARPEPAPLPIDREKPPPVPGGSPLEEAARRALVDALDYRKRNEKDLAGQLDRFQKVADGYKGTSCAEEAAREAAAVRRKASDELGALESQAQTLVQQGAYGKAIAFLEKERPRYAFAPWTGPIDERIGKLRREAEQIFGQIRQGAIEARKKDDPAQLKEWRDRAVRLGIDSLLGDLDRELASVTPEKPEPTPPPTPAVAPEVEAYRSAWGAAMALAAAREPAAPALEKVPAPAAVKAEHEADLAALKGVQAMFLEAPALLAKTPRGQKVSIEYWDPAGNPAKVEDVVARIDALRIEVKQGPGSITIPYGEVRARTLAQAWLARAGKKPEDARSAAAACALEGDPDGAKALLNGGAPERFGAWGSAPLPAEAAQKEAEARKAFWDAEAAWFDPSRMLEVAEANKKLLADYASTAFVRRNREAIKARTEVPREFFYFPDDLGVAGGFKAGKSKKTEHCWTSEKDLEEGQRKTNFVEISFPALAGTPYRCWVYVGGCCQETFSFHVQGTEFTGPDPKNPRQSLPAEPGGDVDAPVKHSLTGLKRLHEMHLGPKEPDRWEWIAIPLPKYASGGTKKIRLLTDQKGFSVAYALVSATRGGAPSEREPAAQEKLRAEMPGYSSQGLPSIGVILREWWSNIGGGGIGDLTGNPNYPGNPTGFDFIPAFDAPRNWADSYGTRIRGYVIPPSSGDYFFWICTDDEGELFLSTDDSPANKKSIARAPEWAGPDEWEKNGAQKSGPIKLEAGKRYYIEGLQKEGHGGDHLRVGWQLPDGKQERPIPGARLAPVAPPRK